MWAVGNGTTKKIQRIFFWAELGGGLSPTGPPHAAFVVRREEEFKKGESFLEESAGGQLRTLC